MCLGRNFEGKRDNGMFLVMKDHVGRSFRTESDIDGVDEYRFSCPSFAREDVEIRGEVYIDVFEEQEVSDREKGEHGAAGVGRVKGAERLADGIIARDEGKDNMVFP